VIAACIFSIATSMPLEPFVLAGSQRLAFMLKDLGDALQSRPSLGVATVGASSYEPVRRTLASART
jgi:hypothetical protein